MHTILSRNQVFILQEENASLLFRFLQDFLICIRTLRWVKLESSSLRSCVAYKFTCAACNSVHIGETTRHLITRCTDKNSLIFKHLKNSTSCKDICSESCFKILDTANTYHNLKIKEALHITWERPNLNKQLLHYNVSLSF